MEPSVVRLGTMAVTGALAGGRPSPPPLRLLQRIRLPRDGQARPVWAARPTAGAVYVGERTW